MQDKAQCFVFQNMGGDYTVVFKYTTGNNSQKITHVVSGNREKILNDLCSVVKTRADVLGRRNAIASRSEK